ncbi:MAG: hypothetical protein KDI55_17905 [Anaerolineae bacterium]|nr:hypothetical protein [Anaerolineae bacterium]
MVFLLRLYEEKYGPSLQRLLRVNHHSHHAIARGLEDDTHRRRTLAHYHALHGASLDGAPRCSAYRPVA